MPLRVVIPLLGFLLFVGLGTAWFLYKLYAKRRILVYLLQSPKSQRYLWYLLRKNDYDVLNAGVRRRVSVNLFGEVQYHYFQGDFLCRKDGRTYVAIASPPQTNTAEWVRMLLVYRHLFRVHGVLFYDEHLRRWHLVESA